MLAPAALFGVYTSHVPLNGFRTQITREDLIYGWQEETKKRRRNKKPLTGSTSCARENTREKAMYGGRGRSGLLKGW